MVQVTRRPRAAARSAIYRDLSFFFDLNATRQLDLRNQAISVPSAGGLSALTQISTALRLVGWSVTSTAPKLSLVSLLDKNLGRLRPIERPARSLIAKGYKVVAASDYSLEALPEDPPVSTDSARISPHHQKEDSTLTIIKLSPNDAQTVNIELTDDRGDPIYWARKPSGAWAGSWENRPDLGEALIAALDTAGLTPAGIHVGDDEAYAHMRAAGIDSAAASLRRSGFRVLVKL